MVMKCSPPCQHLDCPSPANHFSEYCFDHDPNPEETIKRAETLLRESTSIQDVDFSGIPLTQIDLQGKKFLNCRFKGSTFRDVQLMKADIKLCFFDFCTMSDCSFDHSQIHYTVFAGSLIKDCSFKEADVINSNFNGCEIHDTDMSRSDYYFTRFIRTKILNVPMVDCNLKKADFRLSERSRVTFKYSNFEEALFLREERIL